MQPNEPNTPSADVQAADASASEPRSDEQSEGSSGNWLSRLFNRSPDRETRSDSGDAQQTDQPASNALKLTPEELERRIQSETDRREAKRAADARVAARRKLRDEDPFTYAQQERQAEEMGEANGQLSGFIAGISTHHDRVTLDPLIETLPENERKRIMAIDGVGTGLEGRKKLVTESLKALEQHWRAEGAKEAETKLRRNQTFRKQIWSEFRGQSQEPELLPGRASSAADETVSALLRGHYGLGR